MLTAQDLINILHLEPLSAEGGYYRETYRSVDRLAVSALPPRYKSDKAAGTAIYYLLTPESFSALHRLPTDEIFHFYLGSPVQMLQLQPDGHGQLLLLGSDVLAGQSLQVVVPRGVWQGSFLVPGGSFALLGATMAPGFDFADYDAGDRDQLIEQYPPYADLIRRLTRESLKR